MTPGERVNWINPYNRYQYAATVRACTWLTVDLEFDDGSTRGSVPLAEITNYDPAVVSPFPKGSNISPRGIDSGEEMGRF